MTKVEWQACDNPTTMLAYSLENASERKLRLFAVACCRRIEHLLSRPEFIKTLEIAERYADKRVATGICRNASRTIFDLYETIAVARRNSSEIAVCWASFVGGIHGYNNNNARLTSENARRLGSPWFEGRDLNEQQLQEQMKQAQLLRDIIQIRPILLNPSWLTSTVVLLATGIYEEKAFDRIPILADALQDAGCDNAEILNHCRQPGEHVRGCFVLDLVLGKS